MFLTHNAVLHAEAQLELEIGPLDEDSGDRRAAHDAQFYLHLVLQTLEHVQMNSCHTCAIKLHCYCPKIVCERCTIRSTFSE